MMAEVEEEGFSSSFQPEHTSNVIEEVVVETVHDLSNVCEIIDEMEVEEQVQNDTPTSVAIPRPKSPSPHHEILIDQTDQEPSGICIINVNKDPDPGGTFVKKIKNSDSSRNKLWKQPTLLKVGDSFSSFTDVEKAVTTFEREQGISYWKRHVLSMEKAKKKYVCLRIENPNLKYYRIDYTCNRGGRKFTNKNKSYTRISNSVRKGCESTISFQASRESNSLVVVKLNTYHNHSRADFHSLSKSKKLTADELEDVSRILLSGHNKNVLVDHVREMTGKRITKKDLYNIEAKLRKSVPKLFEESLLALAQNSAENMEVITDSNGCFEGFILQDDHMKTKFDEFPEFLFVDSRYRLNNFKVPLYIHLIMDGHRELEIVAVFVSLNLETIENFVSTFTHNNPASDKTKIIYTDRDFYERPEYPDFFPKATVDLCIFQILHSMKKDINCNLDIKTDQKYICYSMMEKIAYSNSESEYASNVQNLLETKIRPAIDYFMHYWHHNNENWVLGLKEFTFYDKVFIQRLENVHIELKKIFPAKLLNQNLPMSELKYFIKELMKVVRNLTMEREKRIENILYYNYESLSSLSGCLKKYAVLLTPYALGVVRQQIDLSKDIDIPDHSISVEMQICGGTITTTSETCTCDLYTVAQLLCLHIFALRKANRKDAYFTDAIADRWMLYCYGTKSNEINITSGHAMKTVQDCFENYDESLCDDPISKEQIMSNEVKNSIAMTTCQKLGKIVSELPQDEFKRKMDILNNHLETWKNGHEANLVNMSNTGVKGRKRKLTNEEASGSKDQERKKRMSKYFHAPSKVLKPFRGEEMGEQSENLEDPRVQEDLLLDDIIEKEDNILERQPKCKKNIDLKKNIPISFNHDMKSTVKGSKIHVIRGIDSTTHRETAAGLGHMIQSIPCQLPGGAHVIRESDLKKLKECGFKKKGRNVSEDICQISSKELLKKRRKESDYESSKLVLMPIQIKLPGEEKILTIYSPIAPKNLVKEELSAILRYPAVIKCLSAHPLRAARVVQRMLNIALEERGIQVPQQLLQIQLITKSIKESFTDQPTERPIVSQLFFGNQNVNNPSSEVGTNENENNTFKEIDFKNDNNEHDARKQPSHLNNEIAIVSYDIHVKIHDDVISAITVYVPADVVGKMDIQKVLESAVRQSRCTNEALTSIHLQDLLNKILKSSGFVIPQQLQNPQKFLSAIAKETDDANDPMDYSNNDSLAQIEPENAIDQKIVLKNGLGTNTEVMSHFKDSFSNLDLLQPCLSELEVDSVTEDLKETIVMDSDTESTAVDFVETIIVDQNSSNTSIESFKDCDITPEDGDISAEDHSKSYTSSRSNSRTDTRSSFDSECTLSCDLTENVIVNIQPLGEESMIANIDRDAKRTLQECSLEAAPSLSKPSSRIDIGYSIDLEPTLMCDLSENGVHNPTNLEERDITENVENDLKISKRSLFRDKIMHNPQKEVLGCSPVRTDIALYDQQNRLLNNNPDSPTSSKSITITENTVSDPQNDLLESISDSIVSSRTSSGRDLQSSLESDSSLLYDFEGF